MFLLFLGVYSHSMVIYISPGKISSGFELVEIFKVAPLIIVFTTINADFINILLSPLNTLGICYFGVYLKSIFANSEFDNDYNR